MMTGLLYFTASYPYGLGENWKREELEVFCRQFSSIEVFPFSYGGNRTPKALPEGVRAHLPVFKEPIRIRWKTGMIFTGGRFRYYMSEFFRCRVYAKKSWLVSWLVASVQTELLCRSEAYRQILERKAEQPCLYFFWAREWAYAVPLLRRAGFKKIFVRFHGYDLYEDRQNNEGYIPYRQPLLKSIHTAILLSESARIYLTKRYPFIPFKTRVSPLGTTGKGRAGSSTDGVLRLVSCSSVVPVKRLGLLVEALSLADLPLEWTHIGGGPLFRQLETDVKNLPSGIHVNLTGQLPPEEVLDRYSGKVFDLFINVSESEGMPVSIMEAFSAGIPVLATQVGGTAELVTSNTGILLSENPRPEEIWAAIRSYYDLSTDRKEGMRSAAYEHFRHCFFAPANAERLLKYILQSA